MVRRRGALKIISCSARFLLTTRDGRRLFIKMDISDRAAAKARLRRTARRETTAMRVLAGLAVPRLAVVPEKEMPVLLSQGVGIALVEEMVGTHPVSLLGLGPREKVAVWAFVAEQLAAFRRRSVLYSDIKADNVIAFRRPLRARIVDFDYALALVPGRRFLDRARVGITPGFDPPEVVARRPITEACLTYQLGMFMVSLLGGGNNRTLRHPRIGLAACSRLVRRWGGADMARLVEDCLKPEPRSRPRDYEAVLTRLLACSPAPQTVAVWKKLRDPYAGALRELGL